MTPCDPITEKVIADYKADHPSISPEEWLERSAYTDFKGSFLPPVSELINKMVLAGKSEEEVVAAVKIAAKGYATFHYSFARTTDHKS
ncbi:hypothetical protein AIT68_004914 [Salmonella enterica subsp. salamae]|uniref:hypothetical protein n=1 Tax=Salmonella enterica TaxID=28901 RepID=UPI0009E6EAE7|nr:hypothetical protein [Salmonella enterica]EBQ5245635.1 hypothetical protein [Salmonella enterica subsp. salamae]